MITTIDTNVLIGLWSGTVEAADAIADQLNRSGAQGPLVVAPAVYAELIAAPDRDIAFVDSFLAAAHVRVDWLLPEAVGLPAARELLFTGRVVPGDEAANLGLVNRVLPVERFRGAVLDIAAAVAATAPIAARLTKVALARGGHASFDAALQWEGLAQPITLATRDLQEGLAAAKERRKPNFTGS